MTDPLPAVEVSGLTHTYPPSGRAKAERTALADVSFAVQPGELFGLLGPNGGGKTTLFKILSTLMPPTSGSAKIFGKDCLREPGDVRARIGVVFQSPSLDKKLTAGENLMHAGHLYGLCGEDLRRRIGEVLERLRVADRAGDRVVTLSGGLQRRVEIAKALLHRPSLLLLDEPSTGLDPGARRDLRGQLREEAARHGLTVLLTTHLLDEAEACDRIAILHEGRRVALDRPDALRAEIGGDVVSVRAAEPEALCDLIRQKFGGQPTVLDGTVRIERPRGHEFIPELVEAFPGRIDAVSMGKPTLEDVFIHKTGHRLWEEGAQNAPSAPAAPARHS